MRRIIGIIFLLLCTWHLQAQTDIIGQVMDEEKQGLSGATVMLLSASDSTMSSFGLSNDSGRFRLEAVDMGDFILQISYVGYNNFSKDIRIVEDRSPKIELGELYLSESNTILNEVTIEAEHIPMGILGDTINYNASAFKIREGDNVEDLLKKLPGIEVDRSGNIKAQGEDVQNVLVDGKEFFGSDPKIATKNLEAAAVDKVQVFDKKSEIAEFTGIDDGQEEKTINLKLKEDHKRGGFGRVEARVGNEETKLGKFNYNRFSPRMQASVIAGANNINERTFTINDYISFMGGLGNMIAGGGGMVSFGDGQDQMNKGISEDYSLGLNLNYDLSSKLQWFSNYFYLRSDNTLEELINGSNFSAAKSFENIDSTRTLTSNQNHRINTKLIYKINPLTEITFRNKLQGIFNDVDAYNLSQFIENTRVSSSNTGESVVEQGQKALESNLLFKKKFAKKGRNWINNINYKYANIREDNDILNAFLFDGEESIIRQLQDYNNERHEWNARTNYTEPLGSKTYLGLSYEYFDSREKPIKDFYDLDNETPLFNAELSSIYEKQFNYHRLGTSLKKNSKKTKLTLGVAYQLTSLEGLLTTDDRSIEDQSQHLLPSLIVDHEFTGSRGLNFSYTTNIQSPSLNQLMPVPDNTNPNFTILGNPDLVPEYRHNFRLSYHGFDEFDNSNFYVFGNVLFSNNRIINKVDVQEDLTRVLTPVNTDRFVSTRGSLSYFKPVRPLRINTRINLDNDFARFNGFVDGVENSVTENVTSIDFSISNRKKKKLDAAAGIRYDFNRRSYSVNDDFDQNFSNHAWYVEGDVYISETTTLRTSFDHTRYSGEFFSEARSFNLWNIGLTQNFFKNKLSLKLMVHDVLNQNIGVDRYGSSNALQEARFNTRARYFMVGLSYKISSAPGGGIVIEED